MFIFSRKKKKIHIFNSGKKKKNRNHHFPHTKHYANKAQIGPISQAQFISGPIKKAQTH